MTDRTTEPMTGQRLQVFIERYRVQLERLNYGRATINVYLRSIRRLRSLMEQQGVALVQLTPDIAGELVLRADWRGDRHEYAAFIRQALCRLSLGARRDETADATDAKGTRARRVAARLRALSPSAARTERATIGHCWRFADRFLDSAADHPQATIPG